jgi:hypothetical protein
MQRNAGSYDTTERSAVSFRWGLLYQTGAVDIRTRVYCQSRDHGEWVGLTEITLTTFPDSDLEWAPALWAVLFATAFMNAQLHPFNFWEYLIKYVWSFLYLRRSLKEHIRTHIFNESIFCPSILFSWVCTPFPWVDLLPRVLYYLFHKEYGDDFFRLKYSLTSILI